MKVASETLKSSDRRGVSIRWNGDNVEFSANINASSMRMDNRHSGGFFHGNLLAHFSMNEGGDDGEITFLNGNKVTTVGSATVPEPCFFTGSYHQKADGCFLR
ncbi:hypothetical protein SARI_04620 [Salmonella enterica subsp. arizonae serovar 62:z4,z23:-]|uniref:Uncharacterized protein n=3 Tax=Salmonella enterica TaxID=28901 RepID=A9MF70_SALAR|nr:hypothetical protein SARI_00070 [Salmonella enterica subsp. arizonae serovar 62:z4,z23:-]ABX24391.1 hypothetical protein SARI_04620 [Salmonella enterica subsp. arizonae serovar 62:z4,z23:-]